MYNTRSHHMRGLAKRLSKGLGGLIAACALLFGLAVSAGAQEVGEPDEPIASGEEYLSVPLFLSSANPKRQSLMRIINRSETAGSVLIHATDDTGAEFGPVALSLAPNTVGQFSSIDLEYGNASKGLSGTLGTGQGDWHLQIETDLDIAVFVYARTPNGFLTRLDGHTATHYGSCQLDFFSRASNPLQTSHLRLTNIGDEDAQFVLSGVDDQGAQAPAGDVEIVLDAGESRNISATDLELGSARQTGRLGKGNGNWRLTVSSDQPFEATNLLDSTSGILTVPSGCDDIPQDFAIVRPDNPVVFGAQVADSVSQWGADPYEFIKARITGDILTVSVSYGGGCSDHEFTLVVDEAFMMSDPVRVAATLAHNSNTDYCEAWLSEDLQFDLTPVKEAHGGGAQGGTIVLALSLYDGESIDLTYSY